MFALQAEPAASELRQLQKITGSSGFGGSGTDAAETDSASGSPPPSMHRSPSLTTTIGAGAKTQGLGLRAPKGVRVVPARVRVQPWRGPGGAAVSNPPSPQPFAIVRSRSTQTDALGLWGGLQVGQAHSAFDHLSSSSSSEDEGEEEEEEA